MKDLAVPDFETASVLLFRFVVTGVHEFKLRLLDEIDPGTYSMFVRVDFDDVELRFIACQARDIVAYAMSSLHMPFVKTYPTKELVIDRLKIKQIEHRQRRMPAQWKSERNRFL